MGKNRMEAFSDGVLAIIITIMVLEMKVPHGDDFAALRPLLPVFLNPHGPEFYLPRHLLEQSSSHAACHTTRERCDPVGQPPSAVLVVAVSFRDWMDGRESLYGIANGPVWRGFVDGRGGVLDFAADHHRQAWWGVLARDSSR